MTAVVWGSTSFMAHIQVLKNAVAKCKIYAIYYTICNVEQCVIL